MLNGITFPSAPFFLFLVFSFIFCSFSVLADIETNGGFHTTWAEDQASAFYDSINSGNLMDTEPNSGAGDGHFTNGVAIDHKSITTVDINRILIGNINPQQPKIPYIFTFDMSKTMRAYMWNDSTLAFKLLATKIYSTSGTDTSVPNPIIVQFQTSPYPYLAVPNGTNLHNFRMVYYTFNGTNFNVVCQQDVEFSNNGYGGLQMMKYDSSYDQIVEINSIGAAGRFNSTCGNVTGDTNNGFAGSPRGSSDKFSGGDFAIADLHSDGKREIIVPGKSGQLYVYRYTETGNFQNDSLFDGDDPYNSQYTCTDGICTGLSSSAKLTDPMYDPGTNNIFIVGENEQLFSNCGAYCMWALGQDGTAVWNSQGSYLRDNCGHSTHDINVTYFQPVFADLIGGNDDTGSNSAICGACMPDGAPTSSSHTVYIECFATYDGTPLAMTSFDIGTNLYFNDTTGRSQKYNNLLTVPADSSDQQLEILIRDRLLDHDLSLNKIISSMSPEKFQQNIYGIIKNQNIDFGINPMIGMIRNTSNSFYYTGVLNNVPYYANASVIYSPPSTGLPLCLNFAQTAGLRVNSVYKDYENNAGYVQIYCDTNTIGGQYYNFTNWSYIDGGDNTAIEKFCYYNVTGTVTFMEKITDNIHLFNTTPIEYASTTKVFTIINRSYPDCYDSYAFDEIGNPIIVNNQTNQQLLDQYNLTANQTLSGGMLAALPGIGVITQRDKTIFSFLFIVAIDIILLLIAVFRQILSKGYYTFCILLNCLIFLIMTVLGLIPIYYFILIAILFAILAAAVAVRIIGGGSKGSEE